MTMLKTLSPFWRPFVKPANLQWLLSARGCSQCHHRSLNDSSIHKTGDEADVKPRSSTYFITTPIFYVNAAPHVGHLFCALLADAMARWQKVKGKSTLFTTGTDEHGLKIQQAAASHGVNPKTFSDGVSLKFKAMFDKADIRYDQFLRTTDERHIEAVHAFWNRLVSRGYIYKGSYAGWYSVSDEAFLQDDDVSEKTGPDGTTVKVSRESGHPVVWMEESNYMFRLSSLQQDIIHWLKGGVIKPAQHEATVRRMLSQSPDLCLPDLSVSRDSHRLSWGIPVPGDDSQTIYVWLDALINYLTVTGYPHGGSQHWPPDCHIIGKDIIRFHAIYWPAFLIAAGLEPPRQLLIHSHWLVDNVKMSKSLGNVIDPCEKMAWCGVDGFRYFLLNEGSIHSDGAYDDKRLADRINTDLANTLGNLLGRCTAPAVNIDQVFPPYCDDLMYEFFTCEERDMFNDLFDLPDKVDCLYEEFTFTVALDKIFSHLHWANSVVQAHEPWKLSKSDDQRDITHLNAVLHVAMETLRVCGILLQPVVPEMSDRLLTRLGVPRGQRGFHNTKTHTSGSHQLGTKVLLQKKLNNPP